MVYIMYRTAIKNIPYMIAYAIGVILLLLAAVFYRQPLLSVLLMLLIAIIPLSLFILKYSLKHVSFEISSEMTRYELPCTVMIVLRVRNPLIFPLLNCQLTYGFENMYYPCESVNELTFAMEGRCDKSIRIPVEISKAGMFILRCEDISMTDMLHFYTASVSFDKRLSIPVFPKETKIDLPALGKSLSEDEEMLWTREGVTSSDIRQFRDYRNGDRIKDIHWKLSAFKDDILVKEYEKGKEFHYTLYPELDTLGLQDTLETFYELGRIMLDMGQIAKCILMNPDMDEDIILSLTDEGDLEEIMYRIFELPVYNEAYKADRVKSRAGMQGSLVCVHGKDITVV